MQPCNDARDRKESARSQHHEPAATGHSPEPIYSDSLQEHFRLLVICPEELDGPKRFLAGLPLRCGIGGRAADH